LRKLLLALLAVAGLGCGEDFESPDQITSLRVLAVQKDEPYARPGSTVTLRMLWHDGADEAGSAERNVSVSWFGGCFNPPGAAYYGCYFDLIQVAIARLVPELAVVLAEGSRRRLAAWLDASAAEVTTAQLLDHLLRQSGSGDRFRLPIGPSEAVLVPAVSPGQPDYGSSFVFFTVCTGELALAQPIAELVPLLETARAAIDAQCVDRGCAEQVRAECPAAGQCEVQVVEDCAEPGCITQLMAAFGGLEPGGVEIDSTTELEGFPILCQDAEGELIGPDAYVAGYSQLFIYEELANRNPTIRGFEFDGHQGCDALDALSRAAVVAAQAGPEDPPCAFTYAERILVPRCEGERNECPEYEMRPLFLGPLREVAEQDPLSGEGLTEQMWINYYVDRGELRSGVRLLNDASSGVNADYGAKFRAPAEPGLVRLWAVAHDNRGGMGWVRQSIWVE
jgi:hypothetical protein